MQSPIRLTKPDARRAFVRQHFAPSPDLPDAFDRLRGVQFDPIAPVGCNHDLVLQARVANYCIGDWNKAAYEDRLIYDGWDKQAALVPFEGWPLRRLIHQVHRRWFEKRIFEDYKDAVDLVLRELTDRGPLMPKEFEFQERRDEWKGSWHGPSVTKQTLRALWHAGLIMTTGRKGGQHVYDLTERVMPPHLYNQPLLPEEDAVRELVMERHRSMGLLRPGAASEVWSNDVLLSRKRNAIAELVARGEIVPVDVDGVKVHATPEFLALLDQPSLDPRVVFIAPLDQFMWDRKMIAHLFGFDYIWEIYTPEVKRRWGYYVLPILFGDELVARAEFWCRDGVLELRAWHVERADLEPAFWRELKPAIRQFMRYAKATETKCVDHIEPKMKELFLTVKPVK